MGMPTPSTQDPFYHQPICTDDYGNLVFRCHYTKVPVAAPDTVTVGAIMPGVHAAYLTANTPQAKAARKQSERWFHESEANCNTCAHFKRIRHGGGWQWGKCLSVKGDPEQSPYAGRVADYREYGDINLMVYKDDPMHMSCYVSRWGQ